LRASREDQPSALVEGRAVGPEHVPDVALRVSEHEPSPAERHVARLVENLGALRAADDLVGAVDGGRVLEVDREREALERVRLRSRAEAPLVVLGAEQAEDGAAALEGDVVLVVVSDSGQPNWRKKPAMPGRSRTASVMKLTRAGRLMPAASRAAAR
jgi:hypothetical protein